MREKPSVTERRRDTEVSPARFSGAMNQEKRDRLKVACESGDHGALFEICSSSAEAFPSDAVLQKFSGCLINYTRHTSLTGDSVSGLHLASGNGHTECCRVLLKFGADVEAQDALGRTSLMYARTREVADLLLSEGANVRARDIFGRTALHYCALASLNRECVGVLLSAGASATEVDEDARTPLVAFINRYASRYPLDRRELDVAVELVKRGADANTAGKRGVTLLHLCACASEVCSDVLGGSSAAQTSELVQLGANMEAFTKKGNTALHFAAENGKTETVCQLIKLGANVNAINKKRNTALCIAVLNGHTEVSEQLILLGADTNLCNKNGENALHLAVTRRCPDTVRKLIKSSINIELLTMSGETALHLAAENGYTHHVQELVKAGARVERCDLSGNTSFLLAARNGHTETICSLASVGAEVSVKVMTCNRHGKTALHLAAENGHTNTVCQLVRYGAPIEACDSIGRTPLLVAVQGGFTETAQKLRKLGADREAKDTDGNTSLHVAMIFKKSQSVSEVITAGANAQAQNNAGENALHLASKKNFFQGASILLHCTARAGINARDHSGSTPLCVASKKGNGELCCLLIEYGAKLDGTISFFPCLRNAIEAKNTDLLSRLVEVGWPFNRCDENGASALHFAIRSAHIDLARWIIEHGGDVNLENASGWTPLHAAAHTQLASRQKQIEVIKLLIARGADPTAVTSRFETPLDIARERANYAVVAILEKAQLTYQLMKAGGEARMPDTVAIRFGGPPGAGKSTLTQALQVTRFWSYFRYENQADEGAASMQQRTKGINCQTFVDEKSSRFTIFDLGGHGEFLATHQMFIGDGSVPVIDCVIVSALDANVKENALKWCSLFASRNQPIPTPWPLLLVATRADTATEQQQHAVMSVYHDIKQMFTGHFRFPCSKPLLIDARRSWNEPTVILRKTLTQLHRELVSHDESPRQPAICRSIEENLPALWKTTSSPVMPKEEFIQFMLMRIAFRDKEQMKESVAELASLFGKALKYLNDYATVLSFNQPLVQHYIVIRPQWLLSDIVGRLMAEPPLPGPYVHYDNGYAKTSDVIAALETEHLPGKEALEMVADLGFCLEQKSIGRVLNPSKLCGHRRDKHWRRDAAMVVNAGRRLKCKGSVAVASAFFPHLQAHFYHRYLSSFDEKLPMWTGGIRLAAGQLMSVEALIESDPSNRSIDIIVRGREGSERECADLIHSLTEETLQKAAEISPGSQLQLFFLSKLELDELSPAGLPTRPLVEYSEERVLRAVSESKCITDGQASTPESPDNLLLPWHFQQRSVLLGELQPESAEPLTQTLSTEDWRVVLLRVANAVNSYSECDRLAEGLSLNNRGEDIVQKLRQVNPHRLSSDIAFRLFNLWLQRGATQLSTEDRRTVLSGVFRMDIRRSILCNLLDDELRAMCCRESCHNE